MNIRLQNFPPQLNKQEAPCSLYSCVGGYKLYEIQCSSDMSEPKYTRNTRQPNTSIRVSIYAHTRMHIRTYAYTAYTHMSHWYV